jgi:hypothetical protein
MKELKFACPQCGQSLSIDPTACGCQVECPTCQGQITVPEKGRSRQTRTWFIIVGLFAIVLGCGAVWLLTHPIKDQPYAGPRPTVDFEVKGIKVATQVPFYGRVSIQNSDVAQPPGPEGFEFGFENGSMVWNVKVGVLVLVNCKITVNESAPRLEMITLMRGNQIISPLEGLGQPGFEAASAKDLNDGLAAIFKQGKTPTADLVFRVRDEGMIKGGPLFVEVRWKDSQGNLLSGKYSLKHAPRIQEKGPRKESNPPSLKFVEGQPVGQQRDRLTLPSGAFLRKDANDKLLPPGGFVQGVVVDHNPFAGVLETPFLRLIPAGQSNWMYEIRALGGAHPNEVGERTSAKFLRLQVQKDAMKALALNLDRGILFVSDTTMDSDPGITWLKQPYEITNNKGDVVFTSATE